MCLHTNELERKKRKAAQSRKDRANWTPEQRAAFNEYQRKYRKKHKELINEINRRYRAKRKTEESNSIKNQDRGQSEN